MCVILHAQSTKDIWKIKHDIKAIWQANPDGAGITYCTHGKVMLVKGLMSLTSLRKALNNLVPDKTPLSIHFRMATHGSVCAPNTHPFDCGHGCTLMHNGIISGLGKGGLQGESDTAHLARILKRLCIQDKIDLCGALSGKYLITAPKCTYLIGPFEEYKGLKLSNTYWKPSAGFVKYDWDSYKRHRPYFNSTANHPKQSTLADDDTVNGNGLINSEVGLWNHE